MAVGVERNRDRRVTEPLGHDLDVHARLQRQTGVGMTKVMQTDRRKFPTERAIPAQRESARPQPETPSCFLGVGSSVQSSTIRDISTSQT